MDQAADSSSGRLQVKAYYAKELDVGKESSIPVMVSIMAPLSGMVAERPPVDLVLVLNIQKGRPAPVKWRILLMEAVEVALGKLGDNDRIAVLADSRNRSVETTTLKSKEEQKLAMSAKLSKEVEVVLMQVSNENCRRVQVSAVNKAIRSDTLLVTALESANSILQNQEYEDKENRASYVIVISNSDEQDIGSLLAWRFLSVHAFGFRDAHNARTMCAIASSRDCTYALLDDERGGITHAFAACIDRITSAGAGATMPIEVKLKCERNGVLASIDAPRISYFISYEKNAGTIWTSVPAKFIVYLERKQKGEEKVNAEDVFMFFTVRAKYGHITVVHAPYKQLRLKVNTIEHDGEVVPATPWANYIEMAAEVVRVKAIKIVADITREDHRNQLHLASLAKVLHEHWTALQNSPCGKEAAHAGLISMLALQMQEMQTRLHYNYFWLEYMLSWLSYQWWQLPLPPFFMDKRAAQADPPLQLAIFPKDRATPWANEYTAPRKLKVVVRVAAPGLNRCPVDLIAVLDASCGAVEKKRRLLGKAMDLVTTKLHHKDRLAIIDVQEPAAGTSWMAMPEQGSAMLESPAAMANEKANETSHWMKQLNKALKLVRRLINIASVNTSISTLTSLERQGTSVVALSAGGTSNLWNALEGAKKILVDRPPSEKEQRAGFIIVMSDSNDDSIIHETPRSPETNFDYIVHAVSFHDSGPRNTRAMDHIARSSNGIYAVLDDGQDQITDAFTACVNKITSIVAVSTVVTIRCNLKSSLVFNNIQSAGQVLCCRGKFVSLSAGPLYAGTVRNFIAIVDNVGWYEYGMFYKLFTADVTWRHPLSEKKDMLHGEIYAMDTSEVFKEVESRLILANTVTVITDLNLDKNLVADGEAVDNDKQVSAQKLMDKLHMLLHECSREARDTGEALLAQKMEKLKDNLKRERMKIHENQIIGKGIDLTFVEKLLAEPLSYMLSWLSRNF